MRQTFAVIVSLAVALSGCWPSGQSPLSDDERAAINDAIVQRMNSYVEALGTLDPDIVADFYAASPDFRVIADGQLLTRDALLASIGRQDENLQRFEGVWDSIAVTPLGRDAALADARFRRLMTDKSGRESRESGTVTWVWVRNNGDWRLLHGQAVHYPDTRGEGEALMQLSRDWSAMVQAGDLEASIDLWADDALILPPDMPAVSGKAAIREYVMGAAEIPGFRISWEPDSAHISKGRDMAYLLERNVTQVDGEDGEKIVTYGKVVTIWRKDAQGHWKNVVEMWNAAPPPANQ